MEIGQREVMVRFSSVLPPDKQPAPPNSGKKRTEKWHRLSSTVFTASTFTARNIQLPASSRQDSPILAQFVLVIRPDGLEISFGDLVKILPICTDSQAFQLIAIYRRDSREMCYY